MVLFNCFSFTCILILGLTNGAHIGKRQYLKPQNEDSSLGIINGTTAPITDYPYMAAFLSSGNVYGSGVIIDKHWILTTAFNVIRYDKKTIEFRVGSSKFDKGGQALQVQDIIMHEKYSGTWDYDIAVVKVKKPIKFSKSVQPVQLATKDAKGGLIVQISGWGETVRYHGPSEVLTAANLTVLDWQTCKKTYSTDLNARLMCTFDREYGPCQYDYGDPIVADNVVYGLYAGDYGCGPGKNPILYANVPAYIDWIKGKMHQYSD